MTSRRSSPLPDITDEDFRHRLNPLAQAVVPAVTPSRTTDRSAPTPASTEEPLRGLTALEQAAPREGQGRGGDSPDYPDDRRTAAGPSPRGRLPHSEPSPARTATSALAERIAAITHVEEVRAARGPKKGVEFLLPERIVSALKVAAAKDGTSMTVKVLEALKTGGYPVADEDFIDLRKLPKR
jgi:hypothetical protein